MSSTAESVTAPNASRRISITTSRETLGSILDQPVFPQRCSSVASASSSLPRK